MAVASACTSGQARPAAGDLLPLRPQTLPYMARHLPNAISFRRKRAGYVQLRRLNRVRTALRHAKPATSTVSEIARHFGFSELGRFAVMYRVVFGERPSTTLREPRPLDHEPASIEIA